MIGQEPHRLLRFVTYGTHTKLLLDQTTRNDLLIEEYTDHHALIYYTFILSKV